VDLDTQTRQRVSALLHADVDWTEFLKKAHQHGVLPLSWWHLRRTDTATIPGDVRAALELRFDLNLRRNLLLSGELFRLLELFEDAGIRALAFKGPVLADQAYGHLALRQFLDLDLLLRGGDLERARQLLGCHGYSPLLDLNSGAEREYLRSLGALPMIHRDRYRVVELHTSIMRRDSPVRLQEDGIWQRATEVQISGRPVSLG
jgi:hypothetical protein